MGAVMPPVASRVQNARGSSTVEPSEVWPVNVQPAPAPPLPAFERFLRLIGARRG